MLGPTGPRLPGPQFAASGRDLRPIDSARRCRGSDGRLPPSRGGGKEYRMVHVALLLACAVVIYLACEWFVNAVEWLGAHMRVGAIAVGTILAAIGTALPESIVTLVAVTFGSHRQGDDIGVGAAMGGPLVVGTIAYGVTGAVLLLRSRSRARVAAAAGPRPAADPVPEPAVLPPGETARLAKDQTWFLLIFAAKVGLGLVAFAIKPWLGLLFFAAYGVYFWREMHADGEDA